MLLTKTHHRFSVDDYDRMIATGILTENDRVEMIRGEILDKMPIGDPHIACVNRLNRLFSRLLGDDAIVSIQNPIRLNDSEPEPDVALLRPKEDFYSSGKPEQKDLLLVIEVAESSLDFDRDIKAPLYAEAGIAEFWIIDLGQSRLEVRRQPHSDGTYGEVVIYERNQHVELAAFPTVSIAVEAFLP